MPNKQCQDKNKKTIKTIKAELKLAIMHTFIIVIIGILVKSAYPKSERATIPGHVLKKISEEIENE